VKVYKKENQFRFHCIDLSPDLFVRVGKPWMSQKTFGVKLLDTVEDAAAQKLFKLYKEQTILAPRLDFLGADNKVVESWRYSGVRVDDVFFGKLSTSSTENVVIHAVLSFEDVSIT
jgi:hypothetical protein